MEYITRLKNVTIIVTIIVITAVTMTSIMPDQVYGATSSKKKVVNYRKSIKSYNKKTQSLADKTVSAKKWANKTKSYAKKSKKTKRIKTLKKLKNKAKKAYGEAQVLDLKRQVGDIHSDVIKTAYLAPSLTTYVNKSENINKRAKKTKNISTLKTFLSNIKAIQKTARSEKSRLTWYEAEYKTEYIEGHFKTVIVQEAEYQLMNVSYYVAVASSKGYRTGSVYDWDFEQCKNDGRVFPYSIDNAKMKDWGCIWYIDNNGVGYDIIPISESTAYSKYLYSIGMSDQSRETVEWFQIKEEITKQEWVDPYHKTTLVRKAGWY